VDAGEERAPAEVAAIVPQDTTVSTSLLKRKQKLARKLLKARAATHAAKTTPSETTSAAVALDKTAAGTPVLEASTVHVGQCSKVAANEGCIPPISEDAEGWLGLLHPASRADAALEPASGLPERQREIEDTDPPADQSEDTDPPVDQSEDTEAVAGTTASICLQESVVANVADREAVATPDISTAPQGPAPVDRGEEGGGRYHETSAPQESRRPATLALMASEAHFLLRFARVGGQVSPKIPIAREAVAEPKEMEPTGVLPADTAQEMATASVEEATNDTLSATALEETSAANTGVVKEYEAAAVIQGVIRGREDREDMRALRSYEEVHAVSMSIYGNNCRITSILLPIQVRSYEEAIMPEPSMPWGAGVVASTDEEPLREAPVPPEVPVGVSMLAMLPGSSMADVVMALEEPAWEVAEETGCPYMVITAL